MEYTEKDEEEKGDNCMVPKNYFFIGRSNGDSSALAGILATQLRSATSIQSGTDTI